jgi:aerobic carbon-monoxide dehydrogenase small subunit
MGSSVVTLNVNGGSHEFLCRPGTSLLDALRDNLGLTAAKKGCAQGSCGTCTVLIEGRAVFSCLVPVETVSGSVETLEGLSSGEALHPLQEAFIEGFATQCGFCTSGMILAAKALLRANPDPTRDDVIRAISGNVCRCTGYEAIIEAILMAAARLKQAKPATARKRAAE